ncbi:MAG: cyclodeaminase/cyclohydrolase family protein [bacterium]
MPGFEKMELGEFSGLLASDAPAPGGGAAAALAAVLAASLAGMVFALTTGKKHFAALSEDKKERIEAAAHALPELTAEFYRLMEADVQAFGAVMEAYRLPKATAAEAAERQEQIHAAYRRATAVPLELARRASRLFDYLAVAVRHGNPNTISDAAVGALFALTAVEGAILNVKINLSGLASPAGAAIRAEAEALLAAAREQQAAIAVLAGERM